MSLRIALIADVHANLGALEAVLRDIERHTPDRVVCLGDSVGYNAEPQECIALLSTNVAETAAGNHDRDVTEGMPIDGTHSTARAAQDWTRERLDPAAFEWLSALPNRVVRENTYIAVHGCYLNDTHVNGYVTDTMLEANLLAIAGSGEWPKVAFCGHTHRPRASWLIGKEVIDTPFARAPALADVPIEWPENARAVLINPGSVGQPRDRDPRACYAIVDFGASSVRFHRVEYDFEATISAITRAGLPSSLGERLREGR